MKFLILFLVSTFALTASAYVAPTNKDLKLATQVLLENQLFGAPIAADTNYVLETHAGATSAAAASVTTFQHQPDVPRALTITPTGTTGDVETCVVTVTGKNYHNRSISETFAFAANASTATVGAKAFKSVSSVAFAADCESGSFGATWIVGVGEQIGLKRCMDYAGDWAWSMIGGVYETTRATIVADADEIEKNTADFNGSMDGSAAFIGRFVQNFRCQP